MKWLLSKWMIPVLAIVACILAFWIFWRMKRGRAVVLSRRLSPKIFRIAAMILVFFSASSDDTANGAEPINRHRPRATNPTQPAATEILTEETVNRWRKTHAILSVQITEVKNYLSAPQQLKRLSQPELKTLSDRTAALVEPLRAIILEDLQVGHTGMAATNVSVDQLRAAISAMEKSAYFDHWISAYVWRKTRGTDETESAEQLAELYSRIEQHARITDCLIRASFEVKPTRLSPRAWMSKGGPSRQLLAQQLNENKAISTVAKKVYPEMGAGTWYRDAVLRLKLDEKSGPATLIRGGKQITIQPGETFSFGRLDLLKSGDEQRLIITDLEFGTLNVPAGRTVSVWSLPRFLDAAGQRRLHQTIDAALAGDARAARRLEIALPLTHSAIGHALRESPSASAAPRLRMILSLFTDSPSHTGLPNPAAAGRQLNLREFLIRR